jgi:hypothetical protein
MYFHLLNQRCIFVITSVGIHYSVAMVGCISDAFRMKGAFIASTVVMGGVISPVF